MDARCKRIRMYAFTDVNVYVWTGPKSYYDFRPKAVLGTEGARKICSRLNACSVQKIHQIPTS